MDLTTYTAIFFYGNIIANYETKEKEMVNGQPAIYDSLIDIPHYNCSAWIGHLIDIGTGRAALPRRQRETMEE